MKLNLGCGRHRLEGFVNVDAEAACEPDQVVDLERFPWPWPDNSVEEVLLRHVLEHLGADAKVFLKIMQELYRVCAPGAVVKIQVPHPRHDDYLGDPTHVRPVTPQMLSHFDRELNETWQAQGAANTPLALYTGVDFKTTRANILVGAPYNAQLQRGEISMPEMEQLVRERNNVATQFHIDLLVRKP